MPFSLKRKGAPLDAPNMFNGTMGVNRASNFNPVLSLNIDRTGYDVIFKRMFLNWYTETIVLENLETWNNPMLTHEKIMRMLFARGSVCAFVENDQVHILPFANTGELDEMGYLQKIVPIPYGMPTSAVVNDGDDIKLRRQSPNYYKTRTVGVDCVVLQDMLSYAPIYQTNSRLMDVSLITNDITDVLVKLGIRRTVSNKKIKAVNIHADSSNKVRNALEDEFNNSSPFIMTDLFSDMEEIGGISAYDSGAYWNDVTQLMSIAGMVLGVNTTNIGGLKSERLVKGEVNPSDKMAELTYKLRLRQMQEFVDKVNAMVGGSVRVRENFIKEEVQNDDRQPSESVRD